MSRFDYDFRSARERIDELTKLYRHAVRLGDELAQQELRALVSEIEEEIAAAHAFADSKIAVLADGYQAKQK
jgi:hypothetical protein